MRCVEQDRVAAYLGLVADEDNVLDAFRLEVFLEIRVVERRAVSLGNEVLVALRLMARNAAVGRALNRLDGRSLVAGVDDPDDLASGLRRARKVDGESVADLLERRNESARTLRYRSTRAEIRSLVASMPATGHIPEGK